MESGRLHNRALTALLLATVCNAALAQELPNIVILHADDLGYGDLSVYNPDAHSPSTICSPSRYGLYSGQLVCRTGRGSRASEGPGGPSYQAPGEMTIADMVKTKGYRTGVFGKWHVGLTWYDAAGGRLGGGGPRGDFILELDALTGRLLDALDELGIDDNIAGPVQLEQRTRDGAHGLDEAGSRA